MFNFKVDYDEKKWLQMEQEIHNIYSNHPDPRNAEASYSVANVISDAFPTINKRDAMRNSRQIIEKFTGHDLDAQGALTEFVNTIKTQKDQLDISMKFSQAMLHAQNSGLDSEQYRAKIKEAMEEVETQGLPYRNDFKTDLSVFSDLLVESGRIVPSMIPTLSMYIAGGALSGVTGGASNIVARGMASAYGGMMEAGSVARELFSAKDDNGNKLSEDYILSAWSLTMAGVGALNFATSGFEKVVGSVASNVTKKIFSKQATKELIKSGLVKKWGKSLLVDYVGKGIAGEATEEALEEFIGMSVSNYIMKHSNENEGTIFEGQSKEEIINVMAQTALSTAKGMIMTGFPSAAIHTIQDYNSSDTAIKKKANKYSEFNENSLAINVKDIRLKGGRVEKEIKKATEPVKVIKVGAIYKPVGEDATTIVRSLKNNGAQALNVEVVESFSVFNEQSKQAAANMGRVLDVEVKDDTLVFSNKEDMTKEASDYALRNESVVGYHESDNEIVIDRDTDAGFHSIRFITNEDTENNGEVKAEKASTAEKPVTQVEKPSTEPEKTMLNTKAEDIAKEPSMDTRKSFFQTLENINKSKKDREFLENTVVRQVADALKQQDPELDTKAAYNIGRSTAVWANVVSNLAGMSAEEFYSSRFSKKIVSILTPEMESSLKGSTAFRESVKIERRRTKNYSVPLEADIEARGISGYVNTDAEGKMTIYIGKNADAIAVSHELAHALVSEIKDTEGFKTFKELYSAELESDGGEIGRKFQEKFASDFEAYVVEGKARNSMVRKAMQSIVNAIKDIIGYAGSELDEKTRKAFDDLLDMGLTKKYKKPKATSESKISKIQKFINKNTEQISEPVNADVIAEEVGKIVKADDDGQLTLFKITQKGIDKANEIMGMSNEEFKNTHNTETSENELGTLKSNTKKPEVDPIGNKEFIGMAKYNEQRINSRNIDLIDKMADTFRSYGVLKYGRSKPDTVINTTKDFIKANLKYIMETLPKEYIEHKRQWYVGANKLAVAWGEMYNKSTAQIAGAIAALSPQKDWNQNVSLAQRVFDVLDMVEDGGDVEWSNDMTARIADIESFNPKYKTDKKDKFVLDNDGNKIMTNKDVVEAVERIKGKPLSAIETDYERAIWVRAYDETYNPKAYRGFDPEGYFADNIQTGKGENQSVAWGSFGEISRAVSIARDGSIENISGNIGDKHKVRNFYNNILIPDSKNGHITVDTHAVGAGLFLAVSTKSKEVLHNFGGSPTGYKHNPASNGAYGLSGTYALYADAYRELAEEYGMLPREVQSVTWEFIRTFFNDTFKGSEDVKVGKRTKSIAVNMEAVMNLWYDGIKAGEAHDTIRDRIIQYTLDKRGITLESLFERSDSEAHAALQHSSYEGSLHRPGIRGQRSGSANGDTVGLDMGLQTRGVSDTAGGRGQSDTEGLREGGDTDTGSDNGLFKVSNAVKAEQKEEVKKALSEGKYPADEVLEQFKGDPEIDWEIQFRRIMTQDPDTYKKFQQAYNDTSRKLGKGKDVTAEMVLETLNARTPDDSFSEMIEEVRDETRFVERMIQQSKFMSPKKADSHFTSWIGDDDYLIDVAKTIIENVDIADQYYVGSSVYSLARANKDNTTYYKLRQARGEIRSDLRFYRKLYYKGKGMDQQLSYEDTVVGTHLDTGSQVEAFNNEEIRSLLSDKNTDPVLKSLIRKNLATGDVIQSLVDANAKTIEDLEGQLEELGYDAKIKNEQLLERIKELEADSKLLESELNAGIKADEALEGKYRNLQEINKRNYEAMRRFRSLYDTKVKQLQYSETLHRVNKLNKDIDNIANSESNNNDARIMGSMKKAINILKKSKGEDLSQAFTDAHLAFKDLPAQLQMFFEQTEDGIFAQNPAKEMDIKRLMALKEAANDVRDDAKGLKAEKDNINRARRFKVIQEFVEQTYGEEFKDFDKYHEFMEEAKMSGPVKGTQDAINKKQKFKVWAGFETKFLLMSKILRKIDGRENGVLSRFFLGGLDKDNKLHLGLEGVMDAEKIEEYKRFQAGREKLTSLNITEKDLAKEHIQIRDSKLNLDEAIGVYVYSQQKEGMRLLLSPNGNTMTKADVEFIRESLSDEQKQWGDWLIEDMKSRYDSISQVYYNIHNKELGQIAKYFPLVRIGKNDAFNDLMEDHFLLMQENTEDSFTHKRTGGDYKLQLNATGIWNKMVTKQEHYIAGAEFFNDANYLMNKNGGDLYNVISMNNGEEYANSVQDFINRVANKRQIQDDADTMVNAIRNNLIIARLGYNMLTSLKQIPSLAYFALEYGPVRLLEAIVHMTTDYKGTSEFIYGKAPQLRNRSVSIDFASVSQMQARTKYQQVVKKVGEVGMTPIKFADSLVVRTLWYGAYQSNVAKGMSDRQASMEATKFIHSTQPGGTSKDSAAIYDTNSTAMKFLLMFSNQLNKNLNIAYDIPYAIKHGMMEKAFRNTIGLGLSMAGIIMLEGGFEDDDDDDKIFDDVVKRFSAQVAGLMPVAGGGIKNIIMDQYYSDNGLPMLSELASFSKSLGSDDIDRIIDRATKLGIAGMETSGLPSGQMSKAYNAVTKDNLWYLLGSSFVE